MVITKEKMSAVVKYTLVNALVFAAVWFGMIKGVKGAENIALFILWSFSICSIGYLLPEVVEKLANKPEYPTMPAFIDITFDMVILAILIWNAYWITGIVYLFHIGVCMSLRESIKIRRAEMESEKEIESEKEKG